jgi:predicted nucleic acid-binding protein
LTVASFTAFYDADVLYGAQLRNFLMHLGMTGLFRARWSKGVHEEWMNAVLRNRPALKREQLERTRMLMDQHAEDALVRGYEDLIEGLHLPHPDDRHVLAAAIRGRADVIVTRNVWDFPEDALRPFGIEAQHPDEFIVHLLYLRPGLVIEGAQRHREGLGNLSMKSWEYLEMLEREGLTETVAILRDYIFANEEGPNPLGGRRGTCRSSSSLW